MSDIGVLAAVIAALAAGAAACGSGSDAGPGGHEPAADAAAEGSSTGDGAAGEASPADAGEAGDAGGDGDAAHPPARLVAYASGYGPDIAVFAVDPTSGALTGTGSIAAFGSAPSFLAVNRAATNLYAVDENATGRVGAYSIDPKSGALSFLGAVSSGGNGPPFVSVDATGKYVLVANYGDGTASVLPVGAGGSLGAPSQTVTVGAQAHMIVTDPSNRFVFVPCKGADYVAQFLFDATTGKLTPNAVPHVAAAAGAGPRHLAFHPGGHFAYVIAENDSTLTAYALDGTAGTLSAIQTVSTLPAGFSGTSTGAEVWVHPSGAWVLGSNRGDDSLVVFAVDAGTGKLTPKGFTKSGGTTPRDFTLDPAGAFVYAANQGTGNVVPFRFDAAQGTLAPAGQAVSVTAASFVGVVALP
ncbi:MAG TPA: lactonase family protein [Polyangiaceae bacterium]|jgi:6-phosphogluconolactonase